MAVRLRSFVPFSPMEYLQGAAGEWFFLILFTVFFMAIAGAVLPKRLTEHRFGKALVISIGLILGAGLFRSRDIFHFNLEPFGFLGIGFVVLVMGIITFGLARIGMRKDMAIAFSYCLMFLTFRMVSPSLYDAIAESLPILNLIFLVTFIYLGGNLFFKILGVFRKTSESNYFKHAEENFLKLAESSEEKAEIDKELREETNENKTVRKRIIKLTKSEVSSVEDIEKLIGQIIVTVRGTPNLSESNAQALLQIIERISKKKNAFMESIATLKKYTSQNQLQDRQRVNDLQKRMTVAKSENEKKEIQQEIALEKKKMGVYSFLQNEEKHLSDFFVLWEKHLYQASQLLRARNNPAALNILATLKDRMGTMREQIEKLLRYEEYVRKLIRKEMQILKNEKKQQ